MDPQKIQKKFKDKNSKDVKKAFIKTLQIVKANGRDIPADVNQHIDQALELYFDPGTSSSHNTSSITVYKTSFMISYAMFMHY